MYLGCLKGLESVPPGLRGCVLTIGNFDGVHLGHRRILLTARALADAEKAPAAALTFDPLPDQVLRPSGAPKRISPLEDRCRRLHQAGADVVVVARCDKPLLSMSPADFISLVVERFAPRHVVEGPDFVFGLKRAGNIDLLRKAGAEAGFFVHVVEPVLLDFDEGPDRVSSTLIRMLLVAGRVADANRCLGREFTLYGKVVPGHGRGRVLEFPTANIESDQILPADGVYAGRACAQGKVHGAAVSIGTKPTFGVGLRTLEAFLIDAAGDFYGNDVAVSFLARLRDQQKFDSPEALKAQIARDVEAVKAILKQSQQTR